MRLICRVRELRKALVVVLQGPIQRERDRIRAEFLGVNGLMPLLMKQRHGTHWTAAERVELAHHLRALAFLSPYLLVFLMPGSFVLFPLVAWWLDHRQIETSK